MVEIKGLEDWALEIVNAEMLELEQRFGGRDFMGGVDEIEKLPFYSRQRPVFRTVSEPTLLAVHRKMRESEWEQHVWVGLLSQSNHPIPDDVALDLIEREIAISWLAHSPQSEAILWRLAPLMDEPILTLAKRFYADSNRTLEELEEVLRRFPDCEWMLHSLAFCSASSFEKRRAYEKAIENHPEREKWMEIHPAIGAGQKHFSYFDWSDLGREVGFVDLYGNYDAEQILEMARDEQTPDEILRELEEVRALANAKEIRIAARANLRRREANGKNHI